MAIAIVHLVAKYFFKIVLLKTVISKAPYANISPMNPQDIIDTEKFILDE